MGFTPAQSSSLLVPDTLVSRSLGATFSELTGQPTPLKQPTCPWFFHSCSYHWDYRDAPFFSCIIRAACYSHTCRVLSRTSLWSDLDRFSITSSYRGSDCIELRIRWWCCPVPDRSSHLSAQLVRCCPTDRPLGFGAWRQRGEGSSMIDIGGAIYLGGAYLLYLAFYVWYIIMHSCLLSCIELHTCDHDIYVIVIFIWYVTCVLSTSIFIYVMSLGYAHLLCFRVFTSMQMSFISCTHAYFIYIEYIMLAWVI